MSALYYDKAPFDQNTGISASTTHVPQAVADVSAWSGLSYGAPGQAARIAGEFGDDAAYTGGMTTVQGGVFSGGAVPDSILAYTNAAIWSGSAAVAAATDSKLGAAVSDFKVPVVSCNLPVGNPPCPDGLTCMGETLGCVTTSGERSNFSCCTVSSSSGGLTGPAKPRGGSQGTVSVPSTATAASMLAAVANAQGATALANQSAQRAASELDAEEARRALEVKAMIQRVSSAGQAGAADASISAGAARVAEAARAAAATQNYPSSLAGLARTGVQGAAAAVAAAAGAAPWSCCGRGHSLAEISHSMSHAWTNPSSSSLSSSFSAPSAFASHQSSYGALSGWAAPGVAASAAVPTATDAFGMPAMMSTAHGSAQYVRTGQYF
jgi:hypothetical protein